MQRPAGIHQGKLAEPVLGIVRLSEPTLDARSRLLGVHRVGIRDIQVDHRAGALGIMLGPVADVQRNIVAFNEAVAGGALVGVDREPES